MSKSSFVSRVPYDALMSEMCGDWRRLQGLEFDAAIGMAIVHAVLDGIEPDAGAISRHLGMDKSTIYKPLENLGLNGVFNGMIERDRKDLKSYDRLAWGYYGGYAAGVVGPYRPER